MKIVLTRTEILELNIEFDRYCDYIIDTKLSIRASNENPKNYIFDAVFGFCSRLTLSRSIGNERFEKC